MGLNICFITGQFYPDFGGVGVHTYELAKALTAKGNEIQIITPLIGGQKRTESLQGMNVLRLTPSSLPLSTILYYREAAKEAELSHRKESFDVIHGQWLGCLFTKRSAFPAWLGERAGLKESRLALSADALTYEYLWPIFAYAERRACLNAHRIIVVSRENLEEAVKYYRLERGEVSVIPNGVDLERFDPKVECGGIRRRFGLEGKDVILYVGGLRERKGLPYLLTAMRQLRRQSPNTVLLICGEGNQKSNLQRMSRDLGVSEYVIFTGKIPYEELPQYYAACDVFVLPSNYEAQGIVLLEAMASQKPVVATRVGGIPETVDSDTGILIPPRDPSALAQAVSRLLQDSQLREDMGKAGRRRARAFDWEIIAARTLKLYKECLDMAG